MPSLRTRINHDRIALAQAEDALATAQTELAAASAAVSDATDNLAALETGTLDLDAIKIDGIRFVNNGGILEPE